MVSVQTVQHIPLPLHVIRKSKTPTTHMYVFINPKDTYDSNVRIHMYVFMKPKDTYDSHVRIHETQRHVQLKCTNLHVRIPDNLTQEHTRPTCAYALKPLCCETT